MTEIIYGSGSVRGFEKIVESDPDVEGIIYVLTHDRQFVFDSRGEEDKFKRKREELQVLLGASSYYRNKGFRESVYLAASYGGDRRGMYGAESKAFKEWQDRILHRFKERQRYLRVWTADKMKGDIFVLMESPNERLGIDNDEAVMEMGGHRFRYGDQLEGTIGPYKVIATTDLKGTLWDSAHKEVDILVSKSPVTEDTAIPKFRLTTEADWYVKENLGGDISVNSKGEVFVIDIEMRAVRPYTLHQKPYSGVWNPFRDVFSGFDIYNAVETTLPFTDRGPWDEYVDAFCRKIGLDKPTKRQRRKIEDLLKKGLREHFADDGDFQDFLQHANRTMEIQTTKI